MAYLLSSEEDNLIYLNTYHIFGRLKQSVNTCIYQPEISKIHAVFEWRQDGWYLTDFSSNGTWLNHRRLPKNEATKLQVGDAIFLASKSTHQLTVEDLSPPSDILLPYPDKNRESLIVLEWYNLLPDSHDPEISLFFDDESASWRLEHLNDDTQTQKSLKHNDVVSFNGRQWQLLVNTQIEETVQLTPNVASLDELSFLFNVSSDEETTQLTLKTSDQAIDLKVRSHHYLTLNLARKRIEDMKNGLNKELQGWVFCDQLSRDLGIELSHFNIQIHRARKQFSDSLNNLHLDQLFERQSGRIRLGSQNILIEKAGETEYSFQ